MKEQTFQATGNPPHTISVELVGSAEKQLLKRGVRVEVYRQEDGRYLGVMTYTTQWPREWPYTRLCNANTLPDIAEALRQFAPSVLPPGAGYPATPQYEARQEKLRGEMQQAALAALTEALSSSSSTH